jgi:hypothetical protein
MTVLELALAPLFGSCWVGHGHQHWTLAVVVKLQVSAAEPISLVKDSENYYE